MPSSQATLPNVASHPRAASIVAATVAAAGVVAAVQGSLAESVLRGALVLVLVPCAVIDVRRRIIPNRITGPAAVAALVLGLALDAGREPERLLWAGIAGGFLLLAALAYPAGMGMGDVKLVAVMGLFLGAPVFVALFVALLANALAGVALIGRHGVHAARKATLPFGPFLAVGGVLAALLGASLLHAFLHLHGS
jgi:leader peptidase (prepilin peptidase)/N-methyltransferase